MTTPMRVMLLATAGLLSLAIGGAAQAQQASMSFFITSVGSGKGGDLGGLEGADRHCQQLAQAAGAGAKTWRAYLSTQGPAAVNARIASGAVRGRTPRARWSRRMSLSCTAPTTLTKQTALSEKGDVVNGRGDQPNRHDILTGSQPDGTAFTITDDRTCGNWTKSGAGAAMVGHHDRMGLNEEPPAKSWNSSHPSRGPGGGCGQDDLRSTGGDGLFYCFVAN